MRGKGDDTKQKKKYEPDDPESCVSVREVAGQEKTASDS